MRVILLLAAVLPFAPVAAPAQPPDAASPYQRVRLGADAWAARGGHRQYWRGGYGGFGGFGFFNPYFAPPLIVGAYYQRPYPYHFDYYRYRWQGSGDLDSDVPMIPASACPCLDGRWDATPPASFDIRPPGAEPSAAENGN